MVKLIHPITGVLAILIIAAFWLATVISEVSGSQMAIVMVKTALPWGLLVLIPLLAAVGGSGSVWSKGNRTGLVGAKLRRMPFIAANGILVLIPCALFLASKASASEFDAWFYGVQVLELAAGATNLTLLGLSMRDGLRLSQWRRQSLLKPSSSYVTTLIGRESVAEGTVTFRFKRPTRFSFKAGQAVYLVLPALAGADNKGRQRTFSLSSSPHDPDLAITTRVGESVFKETLLEMPFGTDVKLEGPYGGMYFDERRPAVFIAGGIGIIPFRCMITEAVNRGLRQKIVLFYSMRSRASAAFLDELLDLAEKERNFVLVPTAKDISDLPSGWEHGRVNRGMIERRAGSLADAVYYLAGPPPMVKDVRAMLSAAGVGKADVRAEEFAGYQ